MEPTPSTENPTEEPTEEPTEPTLESAKKAVEAEADALAEAARSPNVVPARKALQYPDAEVTNELPAWVEIPEDLAIPEGVQIGFLKFKAEWTLVPSMGDRQCVVWSLTDLDERVAYARVGDNLNMASNELARQMLRCVDGVKVNWGARRGKPGNPDDFWREIGSRCRSLIVKFWSQTHNMDAAEVAYFFEHCVAVRTMV